VLAHARALLTSSPEGRTAYAFAGLELVPPGVVLYRNGARTRMPPRPTPAELSLYGGVGRKP
jgi:hypothetical protein